MTEKKTCFVVCPISSADSEERKRSDNLLKHIISPICEPLQYEVIRVDQINSNDRIDQTILNYLMNSELVIADLTNSNPNAFFELGYRTALGKPVIQMAYEGYSIPFDISAIRTIFYVTNDFDKADMAKSKLQATIEGIEAENKVISTVANDVNSISSNTIASEEILKLLFEIKSSINGLYQAIDQNNKDILKDVMTTSFDAVKKVQPSGTIEEQLMASFFNAAMDDPDKIGNMLKLMERFPQNK